MAEQAASRSADVPKDPISQGSLLWPIFWATVLLLVSAAYSIVDEEVVRRPYKSFQRKGLEVVREGLESKLQPSEADLARVKALPEYQRLEAEVKRLEAEAKNEIERLTNEMKKQVKPALDAIGEIVKVRRSLVTAATYSYDTAHGEEKKRAKAHLDNLITKKEKVRWFDRTVEWDWPQMYAAFTQLKARQAEIQKEMAEANAPVSEARRKLKQFVNLNLLGPHPDNVRKLISSLDDYEVEIKQIHVALDDGEIIDRCESCHIAIRYPIELTRADVGGRVEYTSHPKPELLKLHDPETFGCSPCHNGNGIGLTSVEKAHGKYKHWLWPLHARENVEAGCVQCHRDDFVLAEGKGLAETFNRGRFLFRWRGCVGCHLYEGFDREATEVNLVKKRIGNLESSIRQVQMDIEHQRSALDELEEDDEIDAANRRITKLEEELYLLREELARSREIYEDRRFEPKKVAPNLKEVQNKIHPEWLAGWIANPRSFRPDTKMPRFRVTEDEAWDIAAFLWQSSVPRDDVPVIEEGDEERGAHLFKTRGCLGCHKIYDEELEETIGNGFAANLSRVGEKADVNYLASWIKNPRKHNPLTVMPSLRLSDQDAADIATFLASQKSEDAAYPDRDTALSRLEESDRFERGRKLVKHLGCFGCHEIKGLENEGRIGTELTKEGSKPIERLDFGLLTHRAEREGWYDHKGFFERKLKQPNIWDQGKYLPDRFSRLRMPEFFKRPDEVEDEEEQAAIQADIDALTTYLLGSVDSSIPRSLFYKPTGRLKAIQDGWWVIKKYNCDGCHQIVPNKRPELWKLPWYNDDPIEGVPGRNARPPTLVGEGSRVSSDWLNRFLANPALTDDPEKIHRNGVREGLMIRMPTYGLSLHERSTLVRFFEALAKAPTSYVRPQVQAPEGEELTVARAVFVAGDCYNCHLLGTEERINPDTTYAPNFRPVAERIRPSWYYRWITEPETVIPKTAMPALLRPVELPDGGVIWQIDPSKISAAARKRLTPEEWELLRNYKGDHAELLSRYLANFNDEEASFLSRKRAIN